MRAIWTLAIKDLRLLTRDRFGMFWVLGFPLLFALFFGFIYRGMSGGGDTGKMPVAIIDQDHTPDAQAFTERLAESKAIDLRTDLSIEQAQDLVRRGKLTAYVVIEPGFGSSWDMFTGGAAPLQVGRDPTRQAEAAYLQGILMETCFRVLRDRVADRERMHRDIRAWSEDVSGNENMNPVQQVVFTTFLTALDQFVGTVDADLYGRGTGAGSDTGAATPLAGIKEVAVARKSQREFSPFEITFPSAVLWGLIACTATFAMSIVQERVGGTFHRLRLAPIARGQIVAGKGLACFLAGLGVVVVLLGIGVLAFGVRVQNAPGLVAAAVCTALAFTGLMMVFSVLGKTENAVAGAGWAALMVFAMLGGGMIPQVFMPRWMQTAGSISPVKWGILAFEGAIWRSFSLSELLLPCGILTAVGVVGYLAGTAILARQDA
ncbi:MAG TPA: ABC transporter permease [Phycisphaerae bacterium]|nr:ABC transporter permease [Phycisphaerae bacterium]HNU45689.1 ABC transporter permease [Phycisphaerae bacterium]